MRISRRFHPLALVAAVALGGSACQRRAPAADAGVTPLEGVLFSGCSDVREGPSCELPDDGSLRVFVPAPARVERWTIDDAEARPRSSAPVDGGTLFVLATPAHAKLVGLDARVGGAPARWALRIAGERALPAEVREAKALGARGDRAQAEQLLRARLEGAPPVARGEIVHALAGLAMSRGEYAAARPLLEEEITTGEAGGDVSRAALASFALVFTGIAEHRFVEARAALARGAKHAVAFPDAAEMAAFYEATLASETGDERAALAALQRTERLTEKLGMERARRQTRIAYAMELLAVRRLSEARDVLEALAARDAPAMTACDRADLLSAIGWAALVSREIDPGWARDPRPPLTEARGLYVGACDDAHRAANAAVNLAGEALTRADVGEARARLAEARRAVPSPEADLETAFLETSGRIALVAKQPAEALAAFDRLADLARASGVVTLLWSALEGRGEALAARARPGDALRAFAEADEVLDGVLRTVPLGDGRGATVAARDRSTRLRLAIAVRAGDAASALALVRAAEARVVADVQRVDRIARLEGAVRARWESALGDYRRARAEIEEAAARDWALSREDLAHVTAARARRESEVRAALHEVTAALPRAAVGAAVAPLPVGTVLVAFAPLPDGWVALVQREAKVVAVPLPAVDPAADDRALGAALLGPLREPLRQATRLRVVAAGALRGRDVHALPFDGAPLVAALPVEYSAGLAPLEETGPLREGVLVVADPSSDLPEARAEGRAVVEAQGAGRDVTLLEGVDATRARVVAGLATASRAHYAGHASFGGLDGIASALRLAPPDRLTVGDVLGLSRVPDEVVLSGCETGHVDPHPDQAGLSIALAFLAAGATSVVASPRVVDDATARAVMTELHRARAAGDDLASALRRAQLAAAAASPDRDWSAFRALTR